MKLPCLILGLALLPFPAGGIRSLIAGDGVSGSEKTTLERCLTRTLTNSPALASAYQRHQAALQIAPQAKALPEPQLTWTHFIEEIQTRTGPQRNLVSVAQTIPWFGKLKLRGEVAGHEADAAWHDYENTRLELVREVSARFYEYAYLARETELTRQNLALLERLEPVTEERIRAGGRLSQQLTLELEIGRMETALDRLDARRSLLNSRLLAVMGEKDAGTRSAPLAWPSLSDSGFDIASVEPLIAQLKGDHPALQSLDAKKEAARSRSRLTRKNAIPDPSIGLTAIEIGEGGDNAAGVTLGFRIPIAFKKYRAERAEATARERAAGEARRDAELHLIAEIRGAFDELQAAVRTVRRYREDLLPAAEQILRTGETDYRTGTLPIDEFIDDERDVLDVRKAYWRAVADAHSAAVRVRTLSGSDPALD